MLRETPEFGIHLTSLMGKRIQTLRTRVEELLGKSAPARLGAHARRDLATARHRRR